MPHLGEHTGIFGAVTLLTGEVGERVREIMERGMVAHKPRMDKSHVSRLISFSSYASIPGGPLDLVKEKNGAWWPGWMVASDSSPVELSMGVETDWYQSNRVLLSTIVALDLDAQGVKKADHQIQSRGAVDPFWSKEALRKSGIGFDNGGQIFLVLPGNGILYRHDGATKNPDNESMGFRHAMEEMLRNAKSWSPDNNLWATYTRLLRFWKPKNQDNPMKTVRYGNQEDVWVYFERDKSLGSRTVGVLQACPRCKKEISGGARIVEGQSVATLSDPETYYNCVSCGEQTRLIDACGLAFSHSTEQSNLHIMTSFSVFAEHLLLYSWCRHFGESDYVQNHEKNHDELYNKSQTSPIFVIDGPLALFGPCGRFTRTIRREVQIAVSKGATIFGIIKTGKLRYFVDAIPPSMKGARASYFIVPDRVRYEMIEVGQIPNHYGFGETSYYGQDVVVRTRRGLTFVLSVATPPLNEKWWKRQKPKDSMNAKQLIVDKILTTRMKAPPERPKSIFSFENLDDWMGYNNQSESKIDPTPPLWRVISTLEHIESLMFQQSSIPQVFAHMLAGTQATLMKSFLKSINTASPTPKAGISESSLQKDQVVNKKEASVVDKSERDASIPSNPPKMR